jgi:cytochrome c
MTAIRAHRHCIAATLLSAALCLTLAAVARAEDLPTGEELLKAKCTICHSGHRVYRLTPDQIRPVLERMRALDPDWVTSAQSEHIAKAIEKILGDPGAAEQREAWLSAVDRGEELFRSTALGTTGKSCSTCHTVPSLRNVADGFPKFDQVRKRFVGIDEAINFMIEDKLKGKPLPPNDQKYFDLLAYLKSLK